MGWIDSHVHVWSLGDDRYPLAPGIEPDRYAPPEFGPARLLALAERHEVERIVLIQPACYGDDHRLLLDALADHRGRFAAVGRLAPSDPAFVDRLGELVEQGVRGLRLAVGRRAEWADDPLIEAFFAACEARQVAVCPLLEPSALGSLGQIAARHPGTRVVIDHLARLGATQPAGEAEVAALLALAEQEQIYLKFSAWYALGAAGPPYLELAPLLTRLLAAFGCARVMWGSDAPHEVTRGDYGASLALVRDRLHLSPSERDQVLARTAEEVFWSAP